MIKKISQTQNRTELVVRTVASMLVCFVGVFVLTKVGVINVDEAKQIALLWTLVG